MEGVVEAARRKVSELVIVVGKDLDDTVGPVGRLVPLGDRCSSKLTTLFLDDEDALADKEFNPLPSHVAVLRQTYAARS